MQLASQTLTIIGIPLLVIPAIIICFCCVYYIQQAGNNLKPGSKWRELGGFNKPSLEMIPGSEFTELGLWYRRRAFKMALIFVVWGLVIASYWFFAIWLTS